MNAQTRIIATGVALVLLVTASGCAVTPDQETVKTYVEDTYVEDKVITSMIKARHAESNAVAATTISVETLYGVVLLSGFATSLQEKVTATNLAMQVDGVKAVHDEIVIQPEATDREAAAPSRTTTPFLSL